MTIINRHENIIGIRDIQSYTWATKPAASAVPENTEIWVSDVGVLPVKFYSNGTKWIPVNNPFLAFQANIPVMIPPTGSIADNGVLTVGTAFQETLSNCYLYFGANVIAAGVAAGLYYTEMSSTTAGVIYNNVYTAGAPVIPTKVPFVTTGTGAYTQTTAEIQAYSFTVKGGLLGANGSLQSKHYSQQNNTAGLKTIATKFGGIATYSATLGTGFLSGSDIFTTVTNRANTAMQFGTFNNTSVSIGNTSGDLIKMTKDTTGDVAFTYTMRLATATDWCGFLGATIDIKSVP
jgi:hypothetical protein